MATITQMLCDRCGSTKDVETVDWEIGRETGQIDLCSTCLREALIAVSLPPKLTRPSKTSNRAKKKSQVPGKTSHAEIRAWAKEQGMEVPDKGRVPTEVIQAYNNRTKAPGLESL